MSINSRLKATKIIGRRKAIYRQSIPDSNCARKETVDIDIFLTSFVEHLRTAAFTNFYFNNWCPDIFIFISGN